jgi:hypothetical protein
MFGYMAMEHNDLGFKQVWSYLKTFLRVVYGEILRKQMQTKQDHK